MFQEHSQTVNADRVLDYLLACISTKDSITLTVHDNIIEAITKDNVRMFYLSKELTAFFQNNKFAQRFNTVAAVNKARQNNANETIEKENKLKSRLRSDYTDDELERVTKEIEFHLAVRRIYSAVNLLSREETQALLSHALYQYELKD